MGALVFKVRDSEYVPFTSALNLTFISKTSRGLMVCGQVMGLVFVARSVRENLSKFELSKVRIKSAVPSFLKVSVSSFV